MIINEYSGFQRFIYVQEKSRTLSRIQEYLEDIPLNTSDDVFGTVIYLKVPEAEDVIRASELARSEITDMLAKRLQDFMKEGKLELAEQVSQVLESARR